MGFVRKPLRSITSSLSEIDGNGQSCGTGGDVNRSTTSEIETAPDERPSIGVPGHAGKWVVNNCRPDEGEQKSGTQAAPFCDGTDCDDRADKEPS